MLLGLEDYFLTKRGQPQGPHIRKQRQIALNFINKIVLGWLGGSVS